MALTLFVVAGVVTVAWLLVAYFFLHRSAPLIDMSKHIPLNVTRAARYAAFAAAAYNPRSHIESWGCKACALAGITPVDLAVVEIKKEDGRFYVAHVDDDDGSGKHRLVLVFRGTITESSTNWATNIDTLYARAVFGGLERVRGKFGNGTMRERHVVSPHMHRGFYRLYEYMQDDLLTAMADQVKHEALGMETELIIVGHSLGGALATLAVRAHPHSRTLLRFFLFFYFFFQIVTHSPPLGSADFLFYFSRSP